MKKLVCLMIVALIGTVACAGPVAFGYIGDATPGATIQITIVATEAINGFSVDGISDFGAGGSAANFWIDAPQFGSFSDAGYPGTGGNMIEWVTGSVGAGSSAIGLLYSFDYTISASAVDGDSIVIGPDSTFGLNVATITATGQKVTLDSAAVAVVPEPMTLALLGLGGLFLRRRK